jgi:hypothetical protein
MNNTKCASCKIVMTESVQGTKILNKIESIKYCSKHRQDSFTLDYST